MTESAHEPRRAVPAQGADDMREAIDRLRGQAWMFTPMIEMVAAEVALSAGPISVELDRDIQVVVMNCEDHAVQDAVPLDRRNLPQLVHDFLTRHQKCNRNDARRLVCSQR